VRRLAFLALLLAAGCGAEADPEPAGDGVPARIAFMVSDGGVADLAVARPDGTGRTVLTDTELEEQSPAWSRDGEWIAFVAQEGDGGWERDDLWVMRADGSDRRRLTEDDRPDEDPRWTDDGRIAFVSCELRGDDFAGCRLDAIEPDGGARETVADELAMTLGADLSPDGSQVVYTPIRSEAGLARPAIVVRAVAGGDERRLGPGFAPRWSPDGSRVAFLSDRDGNGRCLFHDCHGHAPELYVMDADGSRPTRLTRTTAAEAPGTWTADGARLVFSRIPDEDSDHDLYAVNADGTCERALTDTDGDWELLPAWVGAGPGPLDC
jgi:Tol biopolymer transport system component